MNAKQKMSSIAIALVLALPAAAGELDASSRGEAGLASQMSAGSRVNVDGTARSVVAATQAGSSALVAAAVAETRAGARQTLDLQVGADLR